MSDDIIRRAAKGDEEAFAALVTAHQHMVYNLALSILRNRDDALDVSQEVFIKVYRFLPSYHFDSAFTTWLYRLTKNAVLDYLRAKKRKPSSSLEALEENGGVFRDEETSTDPFTDLLTAERKRMLYAAMDELSEAHREVIRLSCFCGESYESIAAILGIELGTVKSRINRAKKELRKILERRNYF